MPVYHHIFNIMASELHQSVPHTTYYKLTN